MNTLRVILAAKNDMFCIVFLRESNITSTPTTLGVN